MELKLGSDPDLSRQSGTVDIPQALKTAIRDFRLSKRGDATSALVVKINRSQLAMQVDEEFGDITIEDLAKGQSRHSISCRTSWAEPLLRTTRELSPFCSTFATRVLFGWQKVLPHSVAQLGSSYLRNWHVYAACQFPRQFPKCGESVLSRDEVLFINNDNDSRPTS